MAKVAGIRLKRSGAVLYFDSDGLDIKPNDLVIVDHQGNEHLGSVTIAPNQLLLMQLKKPLSKILRLAEKNDLDQSPY